MQKPIQLLLALILLLARSPVIAQDTCFQRLQGLIKICFSQADSGRTTVQLHDKLDGRLTWSPDSISIRWACEMFGDMMEYTRTLYRNGNVRVVSLENGQPCKYCGPGSKQLPNGQWTDQTPYDMVTGRLRETFAASGCPPTKPPDKK